MDFVKSSFNFIPCIIAIAYMGKSLTLLMFMQHATLTEQSFRSATYCRIVRWYVYSCIAQAKEKKGGKKQYCSFAISTYFNERNRASAGWHGRRFHVTL